MRNSCAVICGGPSAASYPKDCDLPAISINHHAMRLGINRIADIYGDCLGAFWGVTKYWLNLSAKNPDVQTWMREDPRVELPKGVITFPGQWDVPHREYLSSPGVMWGQFPTREGTFRSTFITSFRIAWDLGYRKIYLVGADFEPRRRFPCSLFRYLWKLARVFDDHGLEIVDLSGGLGCFPTGGLP